MRASIEWKQPLAALLVAGSLLGALTPALAQVCDEPAPPPQSPPNTTSLPEPVPGTV
jgi:hypothetical protein